MILDILVFVLGFLVGGLLALAALPAVWRRALRLSGERLSRLVPLSADEISADRDHLRATHAVDLRRTEQKVERVETERAALLAELPRRDARILVLDEEAARAKVEIASLQAEAARTRRELDDLWAGSGAATLALHGTTELADKRWLDLAALEGERQRLEEQVDRHRGAEAGLETRLLGATGRIEDLGRDLERARQEAAAALARASAVEIERDGAREAAGSLAARRDDLQARLDGRQHEFEGLTAELAFMAEQASSAERRAVEATRAHDKLQAERDGLQRRLDAIATARTAETEAARAEERRHAAALEELRADKTALGAALAAARAEAAKLQAPGRQPDIDAAPAPGEGDDEIARLRVAIARLADDVLRVARPAVPEAVPRDA